MLLRATRYFPCTWERLGLKVGCKPPCGPHHCIQERPIACRKDEYWGVVYTDPVMAASVNSTVLLKVEHVLELQHKLSLLDAVSSPLTLGTFLTELTHAKPLLYWDVADSDPFIEKPSLNFNFLPTSHTVCFHCSIFLNQCNSFIA